MNLNEEWKPSRSGRRPIKKEGSLDRELVDRTLTLPRTFAASPAFVCERSILLARDHAV